MIDGRAGTVPTRPNPVAGLFPGYFAMVMATGIIGIAADQQGLGWLAEALYVVAAVSYAVLVVLFVTRLVMFPERLFADLYSHAKGFAFLTVVAGTNVLAAASGVINDWWLATEILWWCSLPLYALLLYPALISDILRSEKPELGKGINGSWFLLTVATQSVVVAGALLVAREPSDLLSFLLVAMYCLGIVLYLAVMTMLFLRWTFQPLEPTEADPPAWIAAGAVAITVLAGTNLLVAAPGSERISALAPVIEVLVMASWATANFWFPVMIAIGVWRHIAKRVPLRYQPSYWALVFPLGMYGVSTFKMLAALDVDGLDWLPKLTFAVASAAWAAAFIGLVLQGVTALSRRSSS